MKVSAEQLPQRLQRELAPIYLLSGEEPLQMKEAADAVRAAARRQGYNAREVLEAGRDFDWGALQAAAQSLSLFAEKRSLELRLPSGKPGKDGARVLCDYAAAPAPDTVLLIEAGKLDKAAQTSKWFKALDASGVVVQVWPLRAEQWPAWLGRRLAAQGLQVEAAGVQLLCERVEGNMLAAAQEVEKLTLLYSDARKTRLSTAQIAQAVADSSRYNIYDLTDAALQGQTARAVKILHGLQNEGVAAPLVLWVLSNEIRNLGQYAREYAHGRALDQVLGKVWQARKPLFRSALQRLQPAHCERLLHICAETDLHIKGIRRGDAWMMLRQLLVGMCDNRLLTGMVMG